MPIWITTVRLVTYAIYFVIGLTGAVTKDIYDVLIGKILKIQIQKVILGGIVTAILMPFIESLLITKLNPEAFLALGFLCGALSFELFGKLSSITGIKTIARDAMEIKEILKDRKSERENEELEESYLKIPEAALKDTSSKYPDMTFDPPEDDNDSGPNEL